MVCYTSSVVGACVAAVLVFAKKIPMKFRYFFAFLIVSSVLGCGNQQVPMGGKITFSDTGEPLMCGMVAFTDGTNQAVSRIGNDGTYNLGFLKKNDGLPKGRYMVYITDALEYPDGPETPGVSIIDLKFTRPATSGVVIDIDGSEKSFDFQVDRP